jgi:hypothetical protein
MITLVKRYQNAHEIYKAGLIVGTVIKYAGETEFHLALYGLEWKLSDVQHICKLVEQLK